MMHLSKNKMIKQAMHYAGHSNFSSEMEWSDNELLVCEELHDYVISFL